MGTLGRWVDLIDARTYLPDILPVKPHELRRRLKRLANKRGWTFEEMEGANHIKVTINGHRSLVGRHAADLKTGTFHGILKQLNLKPSDLED
jgi:predicted RNA binding protein YcfA (HicA-like mRNA interferase family)